MTSTLEADNGAGADHEEDLTRSSDRPEYHIEATIPSSKSEDYICARCRSPDREYGPPFSLTAPNPYEGNPGRDDNGHRDPTRQVFTRNSLSAKCSICVQLLHLLNMHGDWGDQISIGWNGFPRGLGEGWAHYCRLSNAKGDSLNLHLVPLGGSCNQQDMESGLVSNEAGPDFDGIKRWLHWCDKNHDLCRRTRTRNITNLRVIDCKLRKLTMIAPGCPYGALSYVWGDRLPDTQTPQYQVLYNLPKTIEDAMEVCLKLGLDYLWVDRYCINQNDEEEKRRLFSTMDLIYQNAEITIVAAAGEDPYLGLPGVRGSPRLPHERVKIGVHSFSAMPDYRSEFEKSKWYSRGWTYQEGRLSSRRLVFLRSQIYLQCSSYFFIESLHGTITESSLSGPLTNQPAYLALFHQPNYEQPMYHSENIHLDLYQYYEKQLRFSGDVLHAFQGVVNSYRNHEQLSGKLAHFWGLTFFLSEQRDARSVFIEELQWCLLSRHPNLSPDSSIPERNETIFPSWSWAAMMAQDMAQKRSSLAYPMYDEYMHAFNSVRRSGDEIAIFFTHRSGRQVSLEDYMIQTDSYLSFYPWFEIDCWSIWGCVKAGIPLDQYDSVYQWDREGAGYEELHLDYRVEWARAKSSILVIFLRAWEFTGQSATEDSGKHVHESDNDSTSDDDLLDFSLAYCILAKQVDPGIYSRIGLWGVRMARSGEDWDTSKYLRKLLEVQVISSDEQWKKRRIRLI